MTFGPKTDDVTGDWRKIHDEVTICTPRHIGVIESRIRWRGRVDEEITDVKRNAKFGGDKRRKETT
jgi:hypothetical protein